MRGKITLLTSLVFLCLIIRSNAQTASNPCPPNIDFEEGTVANWYFFTGTCCPAGAISATTSTAALPGRHELTFGAGTDMYGGFPVVAPGGGSFSMKLGNNGTGAQAEKARYFVRVPSGATNYALVYRYAVVFQDPLHAEDAQPRFEVNAVDSITGITVPCASYTYVATSSLPGFLRSPIGSDVYYKSWTTATINLSGLGGTTVRIDFATGDCDYGGHFGYGYFDMSCGLFQVAGITCDDTATTATLSAPIGYEFYRWVDSLTFSTLYGTTRTITIPIPTGPTTYAVILTPYAGYGCPDTLYTKLSPSNLQLNPTPDTLICNGFGGTITAGATDIATPLTYSWSPATGLSCTTCASPVASPTTVTVYTVTVTNAVGCVKDTTIRVAVGQVTTSISHVDATCAGYNNGSATVTVLTGQPPFTYAWSTGASTPIATGLTGAPTTGTTYTVTVTDISGCQNVRTATVMDGDSTTITIIGAGNPTRCLDSNGTITIRGLVPDSSFTFHYLHDGVFKTQTVTASGAGTVILGGLKKGVYTNISVYSKPPFYCPYNIAGPVILIDPPVPAVPTMVTNSPVCLGATLSVSGTTASDSTTHSWTGPGGFTSSAPTFVRVPASYADSGLYVLTLERKNCFTYDSIRTRVKPLPFPAAVNNGPICSGDTLFLAGSSSNGASSFTWFGPAGFYSYAQNPFVDHAEVVSTGTYTVTVSLNGCFATTTTDVVVNQTPAAPVVTNLEYCQFDNVPALTATGTNLRWYTAAIGGTGTSTAPIPSTQMPGKNTWYVTQTSAEGCEGPRIPITVDVEYFATPRLTVSDSVICRSTQIKFTALDVGDNMNRINWYFSDGDSTGGDNPVLHSYTQPGNYDVFATAYYKVCPPKTVSRTIKVYQAPEHVYLGGDTTICPGGVAILLSDGANSGNTAAKWKWSTGSSASYIRVTQPGTYFVKVYLDGCYSTDTVHILNDCYINLPNVFTPNGDGMNDFFFPRQLLTSGLIGFSMNIYNRWGELIFSSTSLDGRGWDGRFNGKEQPQGVFVYVIDATFKDGQKEHHQGNVTLLR
ncbi:MAG: domain containing protein [Flavipsychrobacter sp.]|jgi:gliding motility-associated-like protein|nr:domain containing protein [Flavipsychrobacter sp.]